MCKCAVPVLGNVAVTRAYVSGATTEKERTGAIAVLLTCQAIGLILVPGGRAAGGGGLRLHDVDVDGECPGLLYPNHSEQLEES